MAIEPQEIRNGEYLLGRVRHISINAHNHAGEGNIEKARTYLKNAKSYNVALRNYCRMDCCNAPEEINRTLKLFCASAFEVYELAEEVVREKAGAKQ